MKSERGVQLPNMPGRNPFLSADKYGTTHFDPAQTDAMPYPAPRGIFRVDLRKAPRVPGGPVGFMQLASTSPQYMWGTSTGGVSYIDISNGGFRAVARLATPGAKVIPPEVFEKVLDQRYTSIEGDPLIPSHFPSKNFYCRFPVQAELGLRRTDGQCVTGHPIGPHPERGVVIGSRPRTTGS